MTPPWLRDLLDNVGACWEWHSLGLHIGFQYRSPQDEDSFWEVWAYPAVQEIVGGKDDGKTGWTGFHFDVSQMLEAFKADQISASARMEKDPPELVLEGKFRGKEVVLHVCLEPPDGIEASEIIDLTTPDGPTIREKE